MVRRAHAARCRVVVGGPYPTSYGNEIECNVPGMVDHYFEGEAEETLPAFFEGLARGSTKRTYTGARIGDKPQTNVAMSPTPRFDLLDLDAYASVAIQWSRGCPFDCEFCDITAIYGRIPRLKKTSQIVAELQVLYDLGWRGSIFFVDDNFIGNKKLALELLRVVARWQKEHGYPFTFYTEASIDLALYPKLLEVMRETCFTMIFTGIESVNDEALEITGKGQNRSHTGSARDEMLRKIRIIQSFGMEVTAGFIVGMDGDTEYDSLVRFIEEAGIPIAMVGLLSPIRGTKLYERLIREGRLLKGSHSGNNVAADELAFVPLRPAEEVLSAYRDVLHRLYGPSLQSYFARASAMLTHLGPRHPQSNSHGSLRDGIIILLKSLLRQVPTRHGPAYLAFLIRVIFSNPRALGSAVEYAVKGYHLAKVTESILTAK